MGIELGVIAILSLIGTGISVYGQYQAGKTQNAIAQMNATAQERNAKMSLMAAQAQVAAQKNAAAAEFALRSQEAVAAENNAVSIENQAVAQDRINRANLMRKRQDYTRQQGDQRAAIVANGLVESSGTPLDLLVETAAIIQRDQEEQHYEGELKRRTLFREADMTRLGGRLALAGATLDRNSRLTEAALTDAAGRSAYISGRREAEITRLTGGAALTAAKYNAGATLFSGTASAFKSS